MPPGYVDAHRLTLIALQKGKLVDAELVCTHSRHIGDHQVEPPLPQSFDSSCYSMGTADFDPSIPAVPNWWPELPE